MTAALGVNDDEIGFVVKRALDTPYVGGVTIQPVFGSGRSAGLDPLDRLTHTGVLARLDEQTAGQVTWRDLTALPCSHPHCCSVGYLLRDDSGTWRSLVALIGHDRLKQWLDLEPDTLANRIADDAIPGQLRAVVKGSLLDLLSEQSSLSHPSMATIWSDICQNCDLGIGTLATLAASRLPGQHQRLRRMLGERVLRVTVKPFMDMNTMIEERLTQCCVHVATVNAGRRPPVRAVLRGPGLAAAEPLPHLHRDRGPTMSSDPRQVVAGGPRRTPSRRSTRCGSASSLRSPCWAGCSARSRSCSSPGSASSATRGHVAPVCSGRAASWATPGSCWCGWARWCSPDRSPWCSTSVPGGGGDMSGPEEPPEGERPPSDPQQVPAYPHQSGPPADQPWPYQQPEPGVRPGPLLGGLAVGLLVGFVASVAMGLMGALFYDGLGANSDLYFALPQILPLGLSVFLLAFKRTRIAGAGLVMGIAIGAIVMPGVCVALVGSGAMG